MRESPRTRRPPDTAAERRRRQGRAGAGRSAAAARPGRAEEEAGSAHADAARAVLGLNRAAPAEPRHRRGRCCRRAEVSGGQG